MVLAPGFQRLQRLPYPRIYFAATTQRIPSDAADPRVVGDHRADFVELRVVRLYILERSNRTLFLAAEEHEADCPPRQKPSCLNRARRFNHQCRVAAVVERSRAQLPRIQMCRSEERRVGKECRSRWSPY